MPDNQKINCPKCGAEISLDDVLTLQITEKIKLDFEKEQKPIIEALEQQSKELKEKELAIATAQKSLDEKVAEKVSFTLRTERQELVKKARQQAEEEKAEELRLLAEENKGNKLKLSEALKNELELRKEKNQLEEDKKNFEIEKQRQLDEERKIIEEEAGKRATEAEKYKIAQLEKKINDANKVNDELKRKLDQGSQQTQGEVMELELEELLKQEFLTDEIVPVPKGISGADIIQVVKTNNSQVCGQIVWELKKTKSWNEGWIQKLKDDQRNIKAELAVIVSSVLPEGICGYTFRDGVWICDIKMAIALALSLRVNLLNVARERLMSVGKNEKLEFIYQYLTGVEFKQRVESIVEGFSAMRTGVQKERIAYEKIWAEREKQIQKVVSNTVRMYGDLSGLAPLPQIKLLELGESESVGETK